MSLTGAASARTAHAEAMKIDLIEGMVQRRLIVKMLLG
jgi:hypothetical protein